MPPQRRGSPLREREHDMQRSLNPDWKYPSAIRKIYPHAARRGNPKTPINTNKASKLYLTVVGKKTPISEFKILATVGKLLCCLGGDYS